MTFAAMLTKEAKAKRIQAKLYDLETVTPDDLKGDQILVLIMATYGEGEPTDNAVDFYEWLMERADRSDVENLRFAVFGLGNSTTYPFRYNVVSKAVHAKLEALGAKPILPLGLGDNAKGHSIDDDFEEWKESLWTALDKQSPGESSSGIRVQETDTHQGIKLVRHKSPTVQDTERTQPSTAVIDYKQPALIPVVKNEELHTPQSGRSAKHIEFDLSQATVDDPFSAIGAGRPVSLTYEAGDHFGLIPENRIELVKEFLDLAQLDGEEILSVPTSEGPQFAKLAYPQSLETILKRHKDLCGSVSRGVLERLASLCNNAGEASELKTVSSREMYDSKVVYNGWSIVDVFRQFQSLRGRVPVSILLEILPVMQTRFYSISSSPIQDDKPNPFMSLTVSVCRMPFGCGNICFGLASNYLARLTQGALVSGFIRTSQFRLPSNPTKPIILIGAGAGIAPLRGFIQERIAYVKRGVRVGPAILYFGCEHPDKDFLYRDELLEAVKLGALSAVRPAFNQLPDENGAIFVQHLMKRDAKEIYELIVDGAVLYVCGKGSTLGQGVKEALEYVFFTHGNFDNDGAYNAVKQLQDQQRLQQDVFA